MAFYLVRQFPPGTVNTLQIILISAWGVEVMTFKLNMSYGENLVKIAL